MSSPSRVRRWAAPAILVDAVLEPRLFHKAESASKKSWSKDDKLPTGWERHMAIFDSIGFGSQSYSNLYIERGPFDHFDLLGLGFLARHQATINFPKKTMYLQHNSGDSPANSFPSHFATTLGWWEMEGLAPHFSKELLADCIVTPPNLHPADDMGFSSLFY